MWIPAHARYEQDDKGGRQLTVYYKEDILKPEKPHFMDAGVDLKTAEDIVLPPKELKLVRTGVKVKIDYGYVGLLKDRSGLAARGLMSLGGVIDAGYTGEIKALLINTSDETITFQKGDRVIQLITARIDTGVCFVKGEPEKETARGDNGFGSSGLKTVPVE
jgi:dUTP pyrophosphatase